jgi:hypothetical protein
MAGAALAISPASDWRNSCEGKTGEGNGEAREAAVLLIRESSDKEKDYGEVVLEGNGGGVQEVVVAGAPAREGRQRGSGTARGVVAKLFRESLDKGKGWREELVVGRGGACKKCSPPSLSSTICKDDGTIRKRRSRGERVRI